VTEKYSDALKCFEKAVLIDREHIDAWYNLADTYDVLGFGDKANNARMEFSALENKNKE
jgi:Tfp pilus assembly protein PilF